jgi:hypothetical protein
MQLRSFTAAGLLFLAACGGHTPNPVSSYKYGDEELSCDDLQFEMAKVEREIRRKYGEDSSDTGKNVALGVAGAFLLVPWFFMDFSDDEIVEINAYRDRMDVLQRIAYKKQCRAAPEMRESMERLDRAMEEKKQQENKNDYQPARRSGHRLPQ